MIFEFENWLIFKSEKLTNFLNSKFFKNYQDFKKLQVLELFADSIFCIFRKFENSYTLEPIYKRASFSGSVDGVLRCGV